MSSKPNYFWLGVFILLGIALAVGGVMLLHSSLFKPPPVYMETYFNQSVAGLAQGSPVSLRGVQIGQVNKISFVTSEYRIAAEDRAQYQRYVMVKIAVAKFRENMSSKELQDLIQSMVNEGLRIRIQTNPLTGQSSIEADYLDPERYPAFHPPWTPHDTYIPSAPNVMTSLTDSADKAFQNIAKVDFEGLSKSIDQLVNNLDTAVKQANIEGLSKSIDKFVNNLDTTVKEAKLPEVSQQAQALLADLRQTSRSLQVLIGGSSGDGAASQPVVTLAQTIAQLNTTLQRLETLLQRTGPDMERTLAQVRRLLSDVQRLAVELRSNPGRVLFGQPPKRAEDVK